jgi:hypothetical protein
MRKPLLYKYIKKKAANLAAGGGGTRVQLL